ncbi:DUF1684 domain-containing protein [Aquiflexum sp.]|uniref:DUF1684 domain-containing protein n=1 Tax=Aquiflexum sp. TaxID=1872584 RepID=UPI0035930687
MIKVKLLPFICFSFLIFFSCQNQERSDNISIDDHQSEVEDWYSKRVTSLKSEEGWLNLIGLFWLEEGENSFGSDPKSDLNLESEISPISLGIFELEEGKVFFAPKTGGIKTQEMELEERTLIFDSVSKVSYKLAYQSLRWNVINRLDAYGVRVRDLEAKAVTEFEGIERYPVSLDWRLEAKYIPYEPVKHIAITNVLGQTSQNPCHGYVEFEKDGKKYQIDALEEGDELFLIFADGTSGGDTYGGGRYIYVQTPKPNGITILDFNKAYNPPCVFTPYATCPLPPRQNILDLEITAGERNFGEH